MLTALWCRLVGHVWVYAPPTDAEIRAACARGLGAMPHLFWQAIRCDRCGRTQADRA